MYIHQDRQTFFKSQYRPELNRFSKHLKIESRTEVFIINKIEKKKSQTKIKKNLLSCKKKINGKKAKNTNIHQ